MDTARVLRVHQQAAAVLSDAQEDPEVVQGPMQRAASDDSDGQVDLVRISGKGPALVTALVIAIVDKMRISRQRLCHIINTLLVLFIKQASPLRQRRRPLGLGIVLPYEQKKPTRQHREDY